MMARKRALDHNSEDLDLPSKVGRFEFKGPYGNKNLRFHNATDLSTEDVKLLNQHNIKEMPYVYIKLNEQFLCTKASKHDNVLELENGFELPSRTVALMSRKVLKVYACRKYKRERDFFSYFDKHGWTLDDITEYFRTSGTKINTLIKKLQSIYFTLEKEYDVSKIIKKCLKNKKDVTLFFEFLNKELHSLPTRKPVVLLKRVENDPELNLLLKPKVQKILTPDQGKSGKENIETIREDSIYREIKRTNQRKSYTEIGDDLNINKKEDTNKSLPTTNNRHVGKSVDSANKAKGTAEIGRKGGRLSLRSKSNERQTNKDMRDSFGQPFILKPDKKDKQLPSQKWSLQNTEDINSDVEKTTNDSCSIQSTYSVGIDAGTKENEPLKSNEEIYTESHRLKRSGIRTKDTIKDIPLPLNVDLSIKCGTENSISPTESDKKVNKFGDSVKETEKQIKTVQADSMPLISSQEESTENKVRDNKIDDVERTKDTHKESTDLHVSSNVGVENKHFGNDAEEEQFLGSIAEGTKADESNVDKSTDLPSKAKGESVVGLEEKIVFVDENNYSKSSDNKVTTTRNDGSDVVRDLRENVGEFTKINENEPTKRDEIVVKPIVKDIRVVVTDLRKEIQRNTKAKENESTKRSENKPRTTENDILDVVKDLRKVVEENKVENERMKTDENEVKSKTNDRYDLVKDSRKQVQRDAKTDETDSTIVNENKARITMIDGCDVVKCLQKDVKEGNKVGVNKRRKSNENKVRTRKSKRCDDVKDLPWQVQKDKNEENERTKRDENEVKSTRKTNKRDVKDLEEVERSIRVDTERKKSLRSSRDITEDRRINGNEVISAHDEKSDATYEQIKYEEKPRERSSRDITEGREINENEVISTNSEKSDAIDMQIEYEGKPSDDTEETELLENSDNEISRIWCFPTKDTNKSSVESNKSKMPCKDLHLNLQSMSLEDTIPEHDAVPKNSHCSSFQTDEDINPSFWDSLLDSVLLKLEGRECSQNKESFSFEDVITTELTLFECFISGLLPHYIPSMNKI